MQKIQCKLLIIMNIEFLRINLRKNIESCLRLDRCDSRNIRQRLVYIVSLLINASARLNILIDTLISAQSRLHNGLCRHIGTQTHG